MRTLAIALALTLTVAALPAAARTTATPPSSTRSDTPDGQLRAYWVDAFGPGLYTPAQIAAVVAAAKAAHLNAIVAEVVRRGDCFCDRASVPRTEQAGVDPLPFDPLQTLIDTAHQNGLQVFAWVITTAIWNGTTPPAAPDHVFNLHGPSASGRASWLQARSDGVQRYNDDWLIDPGHPDAAQWIVDTALSVVRNYAVDGINLDRIRYPDANLGTNVPSWGYNPTSIARFQAATGRTDVPANTDAQWTQWRRDAVTAIVRQVYVESYAIRPLVRISADTITYGYGPQQGSGWTGSRAYAEQLQDWDGWMREGILDLNIPMNYKREADATQAVMYQQWSDFAKDHTYQRETTVGTALYLNTIASSAQQVQIAVAPSGAGNPSAGWVGYSYRTPDDLANAGLRSGDASRAALTQALQPIFPTDVAVPSMPWKTAPVVGQIHGTTSPDAAVSLIAVATGAVVRTGRSDGRGWFGFVDVAPGAYRLESRGAVIGSTTVAAGQVAGTIAPPSTGTCAGGSVGPGLAPPAIVPSGIPGLHAVWYGASGYATLCAGQRTTATVAYYNSGSVGWLRGVMGQVAYLGTWRPEPGQDMPSVLGGDGTLGTSDTSWPRYDRIALQPAAWVGPGQVAWFQFTLEAPRAPGTYRLYLRPLVEGAAWLEDYGVFLLVTVK